MATPEPTEAYQASEHATHQPEPDGEPPTHVYDTAPEYGKLEVLETPTSEEMPLAQVYTTQTDDVGQWGEPVGETGWIDVTATEPPGVESSEPSVSYDSFMQGERGYAE